MRHLLLLGLILVAVLGCSREENRPARLVPTSDGMPDETGRRAEILIADSSRIKVRLEVGHARKYNDRLETLIDSGLVAYFLGDGGELNAVLRADSARIDDKTGDMCAYGDVSVHSERNRTLVLAPRLCYEKEAGRLFSDGAVTVHDSLRGRFLTGTGFECDDALREYSFYNVTGRASSLPD